MKEIYEWTQTPKTITIKLPTPYKIDPKNFNTEITEYYLQFNILDLKKHGIIYFLEKVDFESSRIKIFDKHIEFFINKEKEAIWPDLEPKLSKEELTQRRIIAKKNYEKKVSENRQLAEERKKDLGKYVVDKSMKLDEEKRKELTDKKKQEKTTIETELYDFVKQYEGQEKNSSNKNDENYQNKNNFNNEAGLSEKSNKEKNYSSTYNQNKHLALVESLKNQVADKKNENKEIIKSKNDVKYDIFDENEFKKTKEKDDSKKADYSQASLEIYDKNAVNMNNKIQDSNEIFDEQTVEKNKYQIRNESKFNVNLTEKAIPHFAARESLSREPPYPKSKKFVPEKNHVLFKKIYFITIIYLFPTFIKLKNKN